MGINIPATKTRPPVAKQSGRCARALNPHREPSMSYDVHAPNYYKVFHVHSFAFSFQDTSSDEVEAGAEISELVNYIQPVHFHSFEISESKLLR